MVTPESHAVVHDDRGVYESNLVVEAAFYVHIFDWHTYIYSISVDGGHRIYPDSSSDPCGGQAGSFKVFIGGSQPGGAQPHLESEIHVKTTTPLNGCPM